MKLQLIFLLIFCKTQLFGQIELSKQGENEILKICNTYLSEKQLLFTDETASDSVFMLVTGDTLFQMMDFIREEIFLMRYKLKIRDERSYELINNDTMLACSVELENRSFYLNIRSNNEAWEVFTQNNQQITGEDFELIKLRLDSIRIAAKPLKDVEQVARNFIEFWNDLNEKGTSTKLESLTSKNLYQSLVLEYETNQLSGWGKRPDYIIQEVDYVRMINADSAICRIIIKNQGGTVLNLSRIEGDWILTGENGSSKTNKDIVELEEKLFDSRNRLEIETVVDNFNKALEGFIRKDDKSQFDSIASLSVVQYLSHFKSKCYGIEPEFIHVRGCEFSYFDLKKIRVEGDKASYFDDDLVINFERNSNNWKIVGFNNIYGTELDEKRMEIDFHNLIDCFGINYLVVFNSGGDDSIELVFPSAFEIGSDDENETIYSILYTADSPAYYNEDEQVLLDYFNTCSDTNAKIDYVQFVVEANGEISHIEFIDPLISAEKQECVIKLFKKMKKWSPAILYDEPVRSRIVMAI